MSDPESPPVLETRLSEPVRQAMINEACKEAAEFYEKWTTEMQQHILSKSNSAHKDAMPPGIREAVMLGSVAACLSAHMAMLSPESRKYAEAAARTGAKAIDAHSLMGGVFNA